MARNNRHPRTNNHRSSVKLLQRPEDGLEAFMDASVDAFLLFDENLDLVSINPAGEKLLGVSREIDIGKNITDIVPDTRKAGSYEKYLSVIETGRPFFANDIVPHPQFGNKHLSIKAFKVVHGVGMIVSDFTERKQIEEALRLSEEYFRALMENSLDAVTIMNDDGTIRYESPSYEHLLGFKPEEKVGSNIFERIHPDDITRVTALFAEFLQNRGGTLHTEVRAQHKDGSWRFIEAIGGNLLDNPVVKGIVVNLRDIKERKNAEEVLRRNYEIQTVLNDLLRISLTDISLEKQLQLFLERIVTVSSFALESRGAIFLAEDGTDVLVLKAQHRLSESLLSMCARVPFGQCLCGLAALSGQVQFADCLDERHENRYAGITPHGHYCVPIMSGSKALGVINLYVREGHTRDEMEEGFLNAISDVIAGIIERKKAEEEVRRLSDAVRMSTDSIVVTDMGGKILDGNEASVMMYGADSRADLIGMKAFDIIAPEDREKAFGKMKAVMEKGYISGLEYHILTRDGRKILVEASTSLMRGGKGEPIGFVGVSRDITERKHMEKALSESEARYRLLAENVEDVILTADTNLRTTYVSPSVTQLTGYSVAEVMAHTPEEAMSPASLEIIMKALSEVLVAEERGQKDLIRSRVLEIELNRKDGSRVPVEMKVTALRDLEGKLRGMIAVTRDITERKKAEEVLRLSEERYRLVVENANEAIVVAQDGMLKFSNSRATGVLGYSKEEMVSKPFIELIHPDDQQMVAGRYMARLRGEELPSVYSFRVVDKTGNARWVEISAVVFTWEGRPATLNFLTDITERKKAEEEKQRMEEQLLLAGRLAAVGELAAGVAHELNNPLAAIQGFAQLLTAKDDLDETTRKDLGIVYRESQRAAKITQNLLSFARRHEPEKQLVSLNEVIEKTLELGAHRMKVNNIDVVVDFAADLPKTMADFFQMQQVFINIVNNAEQAMVEMHRRGRLVVKTQKVGNMIQISFADNGPGIPEENMKRIFDPFFTTKEVGKGTGLGLSICYGLVEAHGGRIYAKSKLGEGATFVVEIPIVSEGQ